MTLQNNQSTTTRIMIDPSQNPHPVAERLLG